MKRIILLAFFAGIIAACGAPSSTEIVVGPGTTSPPEAPPVTPQDAGPNSLELSSELITSGLSKPVAVVPEPGTDRFFVVEQTGNIVVVDNGSILDEPYIDLTNDVITEGLEQGLLGFALHPDYAENGRSFVYFTDIKGDTQLLEYQRAGDSSARFTKTILKQDQPHQYHNGGHVLFGPDGYLYLTLGDGGGIGDQYRNAQNPDTLLGGVLRLDVDGGDPYAIPPDNPYVAGGGRPELFVYGLRNPWRIAFDVVTNEIYITDVGQEQSEEINVLPLETAGGTNFGWPIVEGALCYEADTCDRTGLTEPTVPILYEYICALIGGPVYYGDALPELWGNYVYGDFCIGWVRTLKMVDGQPTRMRSWERDLGRLGMITSFGTDNNGEILVLNAEGELRRIIRAPKDS